MDFEEKFLADIREHARRALTIAGYSVPPDTGSLIPDTASSLIAYRNAWRRSIEPRHRRTHRSREIDAGFAHLDPKLRNAVEMIEQDARAARNLNPRLSRSLTNSACKDLLLNDWGIHHLHLGEKVEADGFVERSGPLLFVLVRASDLYLIDVLLHGLWTEDRLLDIIHSNWPETIAEYAAPGARALSPRLSSDRRQKFRKVGLTTPFEAADGTLYVPPGGGYATSGESVDAVQWANWMMRRVQKIAEYVIGHIDEIETHFAHARQRTSNGSDLSLKWTSDGFAIVDNRSGATLPIRIEQSGAHPAILHALQATESTMPTPPSRQTLRAAQRAQSKAERKRSRRIN